MNGRRHLARKNVSNFMIGLHDVFYFSAALSVIGIIPVVLGHEKIKSLTDASVVKNFKMAQCPPL